MSSKKRKTSFADNDDDDDNDDNYDNNNDTMLQDDVSSPPSSVVSKRSRKTAVRPSASIEGFSGNPDFVRLKQQLYNEAVEELGRTYQAAFAMPPQKQLGTLTHTNRHPEFCRQVFVDYYWQLQALKELYHPYDTSSSHDVVVFGQEDSGQTGIIKYIYQQKPGGVKPQILPELVKARVILVAGGGMHSAALTHHGVALTWGSNDEGQLGRTVVEGDSEEDVELSYTTPTAVTGLVPSQYAVSRHFVRSSATEERDVIRVAVGGAHTLFLTLSGNVYMTGSYKHPDGSEFIRDVTPPDYPNKKQDKYKGSPEGRHFYPVHCYQLPQRAKYICAGGACSAAIVEDDTLYTWGLGTEGQLARSATMTSELVEVEVTKGVKMTLPKLGAGFLTRPDPVTERPTVNLEVVKEHFVKPKPVLYEGISHKMMVGHVALGIAHLLVTAKGPADGIYRAYSSGSGAYGKTGHGNEDERHALTLIEALKDESMARVAAGENHSVFLNAAGSKVYTCGIATYSQVGLDPQIVGKENKVLIPTSVAFPSNGPPLDGIGRCVGVAAGENHSFAWTSCGKLYSWGLGGYGQVGNDPQDAANDVYKTPRLISDEWFAKKIGGQPKVVVHNASGGSQHSLVVASRFKP